MTTDNFGFYLKNRLFQTSQTGGQWYSDTSPFSIPLQKCLEVTNALAYNGLFTLAKFVKQNRHQQQHATVTTVIALATLGGKTQIGSFLFYVVPPKMAKASKVVTVTCCCR
jgi:hypothetical protein